VIIILGVLLTLLLLGLYNGGYVRRFWDSITQSSLNDFVCACKDFCIRNREGNNENVVVAVRQINHPAQPAPAQPAI
jgi:hypothetical protein